MCFGRGRLPGERGVRTTAVGTRSDERWPRFLALMACGASALDDRRRLVGNELPSATLSHPDREVAIVNDDRASH